MAQFEVPQFIDIESKIIGPLTIMQFMFIAVPSLISFFLFFVIKTFIWIIITILFVSSGASLAFIKINGVKFYKVVLNGIRYFWEPKLFLWRMPITQEILEIPSVEELKRRRNALQIASSGVSSITKLWEDIMTKKKPIPKREKRVPKAPIKEIQEQYEVFRRITGEKDVARRVDYR